MYRFLFTIIVTMILWSGAYAGPQGQQIFDIYMKRHAEVSSALEKNKSNMKAADYNKFINDLEASRQKMYSSFTDIVSITNANTTEMSRLDTLEGKIKNYIPSTDNSKSATTKPSSDQKEASKPNNNNDVNKIKAEAEAAKNEAEKIKAELEATKSKLAQNEQTKSLSAQPIVVNNSSPPASNVIVNAPPPTVVINNENAAAVNKRIADLAAQISLLEGVIKEQRELKKTEKAENQPAVDATIASVQSRVDTMKKEYSERNQNFNKYLTSVKPNDKDLYLTSRKASEIYPKIPYYIPGTSETGEFWVEPFVTDRGEMNFSFKFIDIASSIEKVRGKIDMTLAEMEDSQKALFKLHSWSATAHEQKIRKNYEKRVTCFPAAECPPDGERLDGKASTEVRFNIYEDGSTAGRIQRNKGRFIEGYNMSIDSAMLLQAYLNHVITEAKLEFRSGTQDKKSLDQLFK